MLSDNGGYLKVVLGEMRKKSICKGLHVFSIDKHDIYMDALNIFN